MSDIQNVEPELDENEFDIDLGGIETSIPILEKDSKMLLRVKKATIKPNKKNNGRNLVLYLTNAEPAVSTNGTTVPSGEGLISKYFPLQPNPEKLDEPDYNPDRWKVDLSAMIDAFYGTTKDDRPRLNADLLVDLKDRTVVANVTVEKDETYGDKNVADRFKYPNQ